MNDMQKQVDRWVEQYKIGYWKPHEILTRLAEEVGELAREINHEFGPKKKKKDEKESEIENEIGDIIFTLDLDMERGFKHTMDKCYGRDKDRFEKKDK